MEMNIFKKLTKLLGILVRHIGFGIRDCRNKGQSELRTSAVTLKATVIRPTAR